jgi:GNAT superfamily N-acetyltransferase
VDRGYGAVSGLLSMPSNIAKGIAPISAAAIWTFRGSYLPVVWTVSLVSLVSSALAFILATHLAFKEKLGLPPSQFRMSMLPCGYEEPMRPTLAQSKALPEARGNGIARALVARLEDNARSCGRQDIWLLTTTAERFVERAGYERISRGDVPGEVRLCSQFAVLCPSTASCMRKRLRATSRWRFSAPC